MFRVGPLDIEITLDSAIHGSGRASVSSHMTDLQALVRVLNRSSANHEIQIDLELSPAGLLEFSSGWSTWILPPATVCATTHWSSAFRISVPVLVLRGGGKGTVSLSCRSARFRQAGRLGWASSTPSAGNVWAATVT